jgi:hypothetical protein
MNQFEIFLCDLSTGCDLGLYGSKFVWCLVQGACVENVLDSVVEALLRDPNRKFVFAEMVSALNCEVL